MVGQGRWFKPRVDAASFETIEDAVSAFVDYSIGDLFIPPNGLTEAAWYDQGEAAGSYISLSAVNWALTVIMSVLSVAQFIPEAEVTTYIKASQTLIVRATSEGGLSIATIDVWIEPEIVCGQWFFSMFELQGAASEGNGTVSIAPESQIKNGSSGTCLLPSVG